NPTAGVCRADPDTMVPETAEGDNDCSDTVSVLAPVLAITKTHAGNFNQGDTGKTYTITVGNNVGAGPTNGTVTISDTLPAGLTPISATGTGWGSGVNACAIAAQVVTCTRNDVLNSGSSYPAITLTVNVAANATSATNSATVSGGGDPNPHT